MEVCTSNLVHSSRKNPSFNSFLLPLPSHPPAYPSSDLKLKIVDTTQSAFMMSIAFISVFFFLLFQRMKRTLIAFPGMSVARTSIPLFQYRYRQEPPAEEWARSVEQHLKLLQLEYQQLLCICSLLWSSSAFQDWHFIAALKPFLEPYSKHQHIY